MGLNRSGVSMNAGRFKKAGLTALFDRVNSIGIQKEI